MASVPGISEGRRERSLSTSLTDIAVAVSVCVTLSCYLALRHEQFAHPFLVPVTACGIIVGTDTVRWMRRSLDTFDPLGLIAVVGFHFFYVAPILHVLWGRFLSVDYTEGTLPHPRDWRPLLEDLATLNLIGLVLFKVASRYRRARRLHTRWQANPVKMMPALVVALFVTFAAQVAVMIRFGGLGGVVDTYTQDSRAFGGFGWLFLISDTFPILAFMAFALVMRKHQPSWTVIVGALIAFAILKLGFGGLRGSRSNTIWPLFWAAGITHFWLRPMPKKLIVASIPILFGFMYVYGLYKNAGTDALRAFEGASARAELEQKTGRDVESLLLGDLGRTDIQCYILHVLAHPSSRFELAGGRTYIGAVAVIVPSWLWPSRPPGKVKEGTELFYGRNSYDPENFVTRVYGLGGEAMLNFGPVGLPIAFALFGLLIRRVRETFYALRDDDARLLLVPFLANLAITIMTSDSDNIVVFLLSYGSIPIVVLWLGSAVHREVIARR